MIKAVSFGEISVMISPENNKTFSSLPENVNFSAGGNDIYFLSNLANFFVRSYLVSALTKNLLGAAAIRQLNRFKIKTDYIKLSDKGRVPVVYSEEFDFSNLNIFNDRKLSLIDRFKFNNYDFKRAFDGCSIFFISGITPSLSENAMNTAMRALRLAKEMHIEVFCSLDYDGAFWKYKNLFNKADSDKIMSDIAAYSDYLSGDPDDIKRIFNLNPGNDDKQELPYYENILLQLSKRFPHAKVTALLISSHINKGSLYAGAVMYLRQANQFYFSPCVANRMKHFYIGNSAGQSGAVQAFNAGLYYGLKKFKNPQLSLDFALANAILKHNYKSGFNYCTLSDIKSLMRRIKTRKIYF